MHSQIIFVKGSKTYGTFQLEEKINQTIARQMENNMKLENVQLTFDLDGARGNAILTFKTYSSATPLENVHPATIKVKVLKRERALSLSSFFTQINQLIEEKESENANLYHSYFSYDQNAEPQAVVLLFLYS